MNNSFPDLSRCLDAIASSQPDSGPLLLSAKQARAGLQQVATNLANVGCGRSDSTAGTDWPVDAMAS